MSGTRQGNPTPSPPEVMTTDELAVDLRVLKSSHYCSLQYRKIPDQQVDRRCWLHKYLIDRWLGEDPMRSKRDALCN